MEDLNTVRIDVVSKDGREVVDKLLAAADAPGALIGRAKNGSAAITFRSHRPHNTVPHVPGADHYQRVFELATHDGAVRITISTEAAAPRDFKWNRETPHHELPVTMLTASDVGERVIKEAFAAGLTWAEQVDHDLSVEKRIAQFKADVAAGRVKLKSEEELQAERDAAIVESAKGKEIGAIPSPAEQAILNARVRLGLFRAKGAAA